MRKEQKQRTAWAIKHWNGQFYNDTVRAARRDTIECFRAAYGCSEKQWRDDVKYGVHRAVKVTLVETH